MRSSPLFALLLATSAVMADGLTGFDAARSHADGKGAP